MKHIPIANFILKFIDFVVYDYFCIIHITKVNSE